MPDVSVPGVGDLAGVGRRAVARFIDQTLLVPGLWFLLGRAIARSIDGDGTLNVGAVFVGTLVVTAIHGLYEIVMVQAYGATIGKMVMKIRIARLSDSANPDLLTSAKRRLPAIVAIVPILGGWMSFLIGVLSIVLIFVDAKRQTINDKFAKTVVVRGPGNNRRTLLFGTLALALGVIAISVVFRR